MIFELKYFCGSTEGSSSQTPIKGTSKGYNGFLYDFFLVLVKPPLIFLFIGSFTQYTLHFDHIRPITFWLSLPRYPEPSFPASPPTYITVFYDPGSLIRVLGMSSLHMLTMWYRFFNCKHLGVPHDPIADGQGGCTSVLTLLEVLCLPSFHHVGCLKNTPSHGLLTKFIPLITNSVLYR